MKRVLQIGIEVNSGSTGRIAEQIGVVAINKGWESYITYARGYNPSKSKVIKIGNRFSIALHVVQTRLFGNHLNASKYSTKKLIKEIIQINPDIIHLHQIHGYYLNVKILFEFLKKYGKPIVWTLHDCWAFTGHCTHFTIEKCYKWQTECSNCPKYFNYPKSLFFDRSNSSFLSKKRLFNNIENAVFVGVSNWVRDLTRKSFLRSKEIISIYNGIDTKVFYPRNNNAALIEKYSIPSDKFIIIVVGTTWIKTKGLDDYFLLAEILPEDCTIIMVGVDERLLKKLPPKIIGIKRTENIDDLAGLYSIAEVLLCLSYQESFGLTPVESFACGTPAIVYNNTALVELITPETGRLVKTGNVQEVLKVILELKALGKTHFHNNCLKRAQEVFDINIVYQQYIDLYSKLLKQKKDNL